MLGQGSPVLRMVFHDTRGTPAKYGSTIWLLALSLCVQSFALLSCTPQLQGQSVQSDMPLRPAFEVIDEAVAPNASATQVAVRMSWGGGDEVQWLGSVHYSGGAISKIRALGLTQDTPGSVYLDDGNLYITQPSQATYGGVEFYVDYQPGAELQTVFRSAENPDELIRHTILIEDVIRATESRELDARQNRLTVARSPGDWLQLKFQRDHLIFETGETFEVDLRPNLTGLPDQQVRCKVTLVPARSEGPAVWSANLDFETDSLGNATSKRTIVPIPATEGVYDLKLQLEPAGFPGRLTHSPQMRSLQFVALSPTPPIASGELWREQLSIDPTQIRGGRTIQWNQILRSTGLRSGLLESGRSVVEQNGEQLVQLEPGGWQVVDLRLNQTEKPVLLEVEYLSEEDAAIGFSVLQPESKGEIPTYGFDSGVVVPKSFAVIDSANPKLLRHQIVFWPQANQSFLLVSNRSKNQPIKFGSVRVLTGPDRLAADRHLPDGGLRDRTRQFLAFYESPMFPENFGADEVYEPAIDQTLDDWLTFYRGADRLVQYLKANGYTGSVLTAAADSGAIYPSVHLGATPIFDSGVFFASAQDPIQKDVLELLFRMFDREGLTLIPGLAFSGPIPELESRIRLEGPGRFRPVDFRGQVADLSAEHSAYNPLNPIVQRQIGLVVEELTQRYTHHQSFQGVSLLCRPDTCTQLSGRRWGYDSPTVAQFLDDSGGIQLASAVGNDWNQIQNLLLGSNQKNWLAWRANQISNWYKRLNKIVADGKRGRRLYLSAVDIYRHSDVVSSLSPSLHWSNKFDEAMLELGWDSGNFHDSPSIVFLKPQRIDENSTVAENKVEAQMEQSQKVVNFFQRQAITGELFAHRTYWAKFAEIQSQSAFSNAERPNLMRLQQLTPSSWQNRQRFVSSIRHLDSRLLVDGGWLLAMGQERSLVDLIDVYTRLPDLPFDTVVSTKRELNFGAVVVRQAITDGRWYFYCLNDSPWASEARVMLNRGQVKRIESLSQSRIVIEEEDGKRFIRLQLPPYSLVGGFSEDPANQIMDFEYLVDEEAAARLKARLNQLQLRLIQATDVKPLEIQANLEFEESKQGPVQWSFDQTLQSDFAISTDGKGNSVLMMKSSGGSNWIRSAPFAVPETGRLSISVWMRTDETSQPPLRIAVEAEGTGYYRFGTVGSLAPDDPSNQVGATWRQYVVHFDDLPVEEGVQLRVGFDMMDTGKVFIDQVELYDRLFDANDIRALTQRLAAARPLSNSQADYDLCRRMLNSYWLRFLNEYIGMPPVPAPAGELTVDQQPVIRTGSLFQRFRNMMTPRLNRR